MVALALLLATCSGLMIAAQAPTNATIGKLTSSIQASAVSFGVGVLVLIILTLTVGNGNIALIFDAPWWQWLGGVYGAFMVTMTIVCVPKLGAVLMSTIVMFGQLIMGICIDAFGWLGAVQISIGPLRIVGCVILAFGIIATYVGKNAGASESDKKERRSNLAYAAMPAIAGITTALQSVTNSQLAMTIGNVEASTINFAVGFIITFLLMLIMMKGRPKSLKGTKPWQYLGGVYGAGFVWVITLTIPVLGVALNMAILMLGQLVGGMIIDSKGLIRMPVVKMTAGRWLGVALTFAGIVLITIARML